jgi:hypothetical protein
MTCLLILLKVAAILLLACAVSGRWVQQPTTSDVARQFQSQDGFGQAKFGYSHPGQSAETHRDAKGNQVGSYAYISPEGREIRVNYIADEHGYRVDNDHTQETAEVAAARSSHLAAHAAALAAARAATPDQEQWDAPQPIKSKPVVTVPQQQSWSAPQQTTWEAPQRSWAAAEPVQVNYGLPQPVEDTPEVRAAKAEFYASYREAAARAPQEENVIAPQQTNWDAPQQKSWTAPQQDTWTAPQQDTWTAPQQSTWVAPQSVQPSTSDTARQYQSQDGFGQAKFGYSHPGQSAETHRDAQGNQVGSYAYINPEGREIRVNYIADKNGFRVDNDHTQETAEVAAARSSHMAAHAAALAAAKAASPNQ